MTQNKNDPANSILHKIAVYYFLLYDFHISSCVADSANGS